MYEMSDDDYLDFVSQLGLAYVDHYDILRSSPAGYTLAATAEQRGIYIDALQKLRERLNTRGAT